MTFATCIYVAFLYYNRYDTLVKTLLCRAVVTNYGAISHDAVPAIHGRGQSCHVVSSW